MLPLALSTSNGPKKRHRADFCRPVPDDLRDARLGTLGNGQGLPATSLAAWNAALVSKFGKDVERWGHLEKVRISKDIARFRINTRVESFDGVAAVFHAVRTQWGETRAESYWTLYRGGSARRGRRVRWAEPVGSAPSLEEAEELALELAPVVPPPGSGWTFQEWSWRR